MRWLFEIDEDKNYVLPGDKELADLVIDNGFQVDIIEKHKSELLPRFVNKQEESKVIRCSLKFAKYFATGYLGYFPGLYYISEYYKCTRYYPYYLNNLLNFDHIITNLGSLKSSSYCDFIFNTFDHKEVFIRPNNGDKLFNGQVINIYDAYDIITKNPRCHQNDLVILSSAKNYIINEYRFIMNGNKLIAGNHKNHNKPEKFEMFIEETFKSSEWFPDSIYTIDLAEVTAIPNVQIVEVNSFACAGLEGFQKEDLDKIVKEVTKETDNAYGVQ